MKEEEVPQHTGSISKSHLKELVYATDEQGNYTTALSSGWEPKAIALSNSLAAINERVAAAREQVKNGVASPIVYFMELHRMDVGILSGYVGMWQWRVKRHFKPGVFTGLSRPILQKYAIVFDISVDELVNYKPN